MTFTYSEKQKAILMCIAVINQSIFTGFVLRSHRNCASFNDYWTKLEGSSETITPSPIAALTLKSLLPLPDKEQDEADVQGEDEHPDNAHHQDDNDRRLVRALQV